MTDDRKPLDAALDVVFFAPIGFVLTLGEEIPKLAAKGRSRLGGQVATARVVGQFAVAQGRKEARRRTGMDAPRSTSPAPPSTVVPEMDRAARPVRSQPVPPIPAPGANGSVARPVLSAIPADELAIPGYDSLSASQVVQRLAGLAPPELEAVRGYETANRNRRTILARVAQLQGS